MKRSVVVVLPAALVLCVACGGALDGQSARPERAPTLLGDPLPDPFSLVAIDCGDGDPLRVVVDADAVAKLQDAVQLTIYDPLGPICSISVSAPPPPAPAPVVVSPTATTALTIDTASTYLETDDPRFRFPFVFGNGQYRNNHIGGCLVRSHLKARQDRRGFRGFQEVRGLEVQCPGRVRATVTCIAVVGNAAQIRGIIVEADGIFAPRLGEVIITDVVDNGRPSDTNRDLIDQKTTARDPAGVAENGCVVADDPLLAPVLKGNFTVRQRGAEDD